MLYSPKPRRSSLKSRRQQSLLQTVEKDCLRGRSFGWGIDVHACRHQPVSDTELGEGVGALGSEPLLQCQVARVLTVEEINSDKLFKTTIDIGGGAIRQVKK